MTSRAVWNQRAALRSVCALFALALLVACRGEEPAREYGYVAVPEVTLRDRLAVVYNKVGTAANGERVEILERQKRFYRVRTEQGAEGWVEQRFVVSQDVFDRFEQMAREHANTLAQGEAVARAELNMRLQPSREGERLYRLQEGDRVAVLRRASTPRESAGGDPNAPPPKEDWWLVRSQTQHVGWVLGRLIDLDVPLEIAQYAEGQRIVAYFVLNEVEDDGNRYPQALLALSQPKDGLPQDFDQIRIFTWNARVNRYETAYRERKLAGELPIATGMEDFGKEGTLPVFTIRSKDKDGNLQERKYKMNGVMVRRVETTPKTS